jgi:hypothetical protein
MIMNDRYFHLRLDATYQGNENKIDDLSVEVLHGNKWEVLSLDIRSPGFLLFINGLFSCQHLYMRTNSAERNIQLLSASGEMKVVAGENWDIEEVQVSFKAKILQGQLAGDDLDYIVERMHHCPVSTNLPDQLPLKILVTYV